MPCPLLHRLPEPPTHNLRWPKGQCFSFLLQKMHTHGSKFFPCCRLPTFHSQLCPLFLGTLRSSHCLQESSMHLHAKLLPPRFPLTEILLTCTSLHCIDLCEAPTHEVTCILFCDPIGLVHASVQQQWHWILSSDVPMASSCPLASPGHGLYFNSSLSCPWLAWHSTK